MTIENTFGFTIETPSFSCGASSEDGLQVDLWCLCTGTEIPLIDSETNEKILDENGNQRTFKATSELLKNSIGTSKDIIFDCDHNLETHIGDVSELYLDENNNPQKMGARGVIKDPIWVKKVKEDKYSGISVYGKFESQNSLNISRISFLSVRDGACNKTKCHVKETSAAASNIAQSWDGTKSSNDLFEKFSDDEGNLQKNKLKKYFLIVEESGENKGDYKYPIGEIINGTAQISKEGCWTAYNFANREEEQKNHPGLLNKLIKIMKREGIELPPSAEANDPSNKINKEVTNMPVELNDEVKDFLKETITSTIKTSLEDVQTTIMGSVNEQFEDFKAGFQASAPNSAPEGPEIEPAEIEPPDFWTLAKENIGLTEEEFLEMKDAAGKVLDMATQLTDYETKFEDLNSKLTSANAFIEDVEKRELVEKLPPALRDGTEKVKKVVDGKEVETEVQKIDLLFKEMKENPGKFWNKHIDAVAHYKIQKEQPGFAAGSPQSNMEPETIKRNEELKRLRPHGR